MRLTLITLFIFLLFSCNQKTEINLFEGESLVFNELATTWDEAMPLGNGMVGNLVWQKNDKLRFSLDRADLWDLRPMENLKFDNWKFQDVYRHWKNDTYREVQNQFDMPYGLLPAPSKIPGGALEFDISQLGKVKSVVLDIEKAVCIVEWESGTKLTTFVHAKNPVGWYKFENLEKPVNVELISPAYNRPNEEGITDQSRTALNKLGYEQGEIIVGENSLQYNQKGWGDFSYQISTQWDESENGLTGCWSVSSDNNSSENKQLASEVVKNEIAAGFKASLKTHELWWGNYWAKSAISVPDSVLQRQYYLEMYKFGSAARADAPPISLQSVWTADHGKLPPWKGDFHHDLNTQLSYWPSYAGNYLQLEEGFINWLWKCRPAFKNYTTNYFGVNGLNVPGVSTLEGEPMGGWIQYAFGQGVGAWLGHHFYLHWKYSMDRNFLETRAYPWVKDVAVFLEEISVIDDSGKRKLKISSSPEIYNNSRKAWFSETTNFDLALIRWNFEKAAELASELGLKDEAAHWNKILAEWPALAVDEETGLEFAPGFPYNESHRHFSHQMAYHPLGLLDFSKGKADQKIIENTITNLEKQGPDYWTGYSYSWMGNLYARAFQGEKAADVLRIFANCFCLKNSFHVNGDQCKEGHSKFTYRPFTLEGNFAFASALQEMLIQSHTGVVKLFPAIPASWDNVSFDNLRTYGAFLVTAEKKEGAVAYMKVKSEKGGVFKILNPFNGKEPKIEGTEFKLDGDIITFEMNPGQELELR
ncbi:glycoside hydrolase N-terminal domain-containing protein [Prolixibacteraceae bacterium Z1-6]|uniref:Glycoside hydrolase N-terminal domain-containing protein n=1 Tax=Draconibacterium aestuarii TaxID=2998507 RepID=A0A9X3F1E6_9BACT|nr:glycoside hydrolase N-terminal domain-containing protein [Prolixibacteraceae bacterium Z1-6]